MPWWLPGTSRNVKQGSGHGFYADIEEEDSDEPEGYGDENDEEEDDEFGGYAEDEEERDYEDDLAEDEGEDEYNEAHEHETGAGLS